MDEPRSGEGRSPYILEVCKGEQLTKNNKRRTYFLIKIVKNKVAPPFKTVSLDFYFEEGFSKIDEIITIAVNKKIINKSGGCSSYEDVKLGQGKIKTKEI